MSPAYPRWSLFFFLLHLISKFGFLIKHKRNTDSKQNFSQSVWHCPTQPCAWSINPTECTCMLACQLPCYVFVPTFAHTHYDLLEAETRHHSAVPFSSVLAQAKATYIFMASKYMLQKYVVAEFPELLSIAYLTLK